MVPKINSLREQDSSCSLSFISDLGRRYFVGIVNFFFDKKNTAGPLGRTICFYFFLFLFIGSTAKSQTFHLQGKLLDGSEPAVGIPILLNSQTVGISNSDGFFDIPAKFGDSLSIKSLFYSIQETVLQDSLYKKLFLTSKSIEMNGVIVTYYKKQFIDSVLMSAFGKLKATPNIMLAIERQTVFKENKMVLMNGGLLYFNFSKPIKSFKDASMIGVSVSAACNLVDSVGSMARVVVNQRYNSLLGANPKVSFDWIKPYVLTESIEVHDGFTLIEVNAVTSKKLKCHFSWRLLPSGELDEINYYEEAKKDHFWLFSCIYRNGICSSITENCNEAFLGRNYNSVDSIRFYEKYVQIKGIGKELIAPNYDLRLYLGSPHNCESIKNYNLLEKLMY